MLLTIGALWTRLPIRAQIALWESVAYQPIGSGVTRPGHHWLSARLVTAITAATSS